MAAGAGVEENRRAFGRHWMAFLAVWVGSMVNVFIGETNGSRVANYDRVESCDCVEKKCKIVSHFALTEIRLSRLSC